MTSTVIYEGELRTVATHLQSGTEIETDAPVDNQGKGERFSPTDLVATATGRLYGDHHGHQVPRSGGRPPRHEAFCIEDHEARAPPHRRYPDRFRIPGHIAGG